MKMLILADDFTGAMDTGCPFAQEGLSTSVYMESPEETRSSDEVLVVDTYRVKDGLLYEHWGTVQPLPPEQFGNPKLI